MAVHAKNRQLALDANMLYDLAAGSNFAHTFKEVFQEKGYRLLAPPTVIQEATYAAKKKTGEEQKLALRSLQSLREWGISPFDLKSVGHGITEQFARKLIWKGILREGEFNDGLIVAETALASIPMLVTSDDDLVGMNKDLLAACFADSDLPTVSIVHPRPLLGALR